MYFSLALTLNYLIVSSEIYHQIIVEMRKSKQHAGSHLTAFRGDTLSVFTFTVPSFLSTDCTFPHWVCWQSVPGHYIKPYTDNSALTCLNMYWSSVKSTLHTSLAFTLPKFWFQSPLFVHLFSNLFLSLYWLVVNCWVKQSQSCMCGIFYVHV